MGLFRRRRPAEDELDAQEEALDASAPGIDEAVASPPRPLGPWDAADAPQDERPRVDLGGLRVPVLPDTELRVEVSPEGEIVAITLVRAPSAMQVSAFAAPRTEGIWAEIREEIRASLTAAGGGGEEVDGPFGVELRAMVPTEIPGRGRMLAPARFVGVDGPRWFLRALLTGPAATEPGAGDDLLAALRDVVVVRGSDPMAVRDALPLRLPKEVQAQATEPPAAGSSGTG